MVYIKGVAGQTEIFFYSLGFGFLLGILYDVFRTARLVFCRSRVFTAVADLLYFTVCGFASFLFLLAVDGGNLRFYSSSGVILGWLIYYFSLGTVAVKITCAISRFFRSIFAAISRSFKRTVKKSEKLSLFFKKITRKSRKKAKFNLQNHRGIVYNLYSYIKNKNIAKKE